jgi:hypothetical protein
MLPIMSEERVAAPVAPSRERLRDAYFADVSRLTFGLVHGERWRLRFGPVTILRFGAPRFRRTAWTWTITGGVLARAPGGTLAFGWSEGELVEALDGYHPLLPGPLYRVTQRPLHALLSRLFLLRLRGRTPPPGVPAGPAQRLLTAGLDVALCAGLTALLTRRRRLATFTAVAAVYHAGFWTGGGRTPAARLTGQRLVSVDGGPVSLGQALVRLAALPFTLRRLRAVHDEAAATEVVEA